MSIIEAIILGIIQGLSEFIPISSTAHLTLAGSYMGLIDPNNPEKWTAFIAVVQLGTLFAVIYYFYNDIKNTSIDFIKENFTKNKRKFKQQSVNSKLAWFVVVGSIPVVTIGIAFKKIIEGNLTKDPIVIGSSLIGLAVILYIADKTATFKRDMNQLYWKDAWVVGLAQCVALIPGSSRSGTTITAGLFLGLNRETAAKFSFLLGIPAILGSGLLEFYQEYPHLDNSQFLTLSIAIICSAISGYFAIDFLIKFLKKRSTLLFVNYRIILGIIVLLNVYLSS